MNFKNSFSLLFCGVLFCLLVFIPEVHAQNAHEPWEGAYSEEAFAGGEIRQVYCDLVQLTEGTFGGLLFAAAGVMALGFAAFGMSHHSHTAVMTGIGAFAISAGVSLYFGDLGCGGGGGESGGGTATARTEAKDIMTHGEFYSDTIDENDLF